jgi:hypothetical protein
VANAPWRVIAQRALTGEFLTYSLPLTDTTTSRELSGPGGVFGSINPAMFKEKAADGRPLLEEWSTALYVEQDGELRGGGLVSRLSRDKPTLNVEAAGFSAWPVGQPYVENYLPTEYEDPVKVIQEVWRHLQSFSNSHLGVTVADAATWLLLSGGSGPYKIFDYDSRDCGDIISTIAQTVPLDWSEVHSWADSTHTTIKHHINIGFPRLGRKRTDLRFASGENVDDFSPVGADGENFSNDVYGFGEGSGISMLRSRQTSNDGRLRRAVAVNFRAAGSQGYLDALTAQELRVRDLLDDVTELTIHDTPAAPIASITPGDDVLAYLDVEWIGIVPIWLRVLAINEAGSAPGVAVLKTQRSDKFTYLADKSPTGEKVVIQA